MSKSLEERNQELEAQVKQAKEEVAKFRHERDQASVAYAQMRQQAERLHAQLQEPRDEEEPPAPSRGRQVASEGQDGAQAGLDPRAIEAMIDRLMDKKFNPRLQATEEMARQSLMQVGGRDVDDALGRYKSDHPEHELIPSFDDLVAMKASMRARQMQDRGHPIEDIKRVAIEEAEVIVKDFNTKQKSRQDANEARRKASEEKASIPPIAAAAGFDKWEKPKDLKEARAVAEQILERYQSSGKLNLEQ